MGLDFRPLTPEESATLGAALRRNAGDGASLLQDPRTTTFTGSSTDEVRQLLTDEEVISQIRSVPTHY